MKIRTSLSLTAYVSVLLFSLSVWPVFALPSEAMIQRYNQAAQGDEKLVEPLYADLEKLIAQEGATALSLVYLGSTRTLMGRDAFLPWKKMRYSEEGLATIEKGLSLLTSQETQSSEHHGKFRRDTQRFTSSNACYGSGGGHLYRHARHV